MTWEVVVAMVKKSEVATSDVHFFADLVTYAHISFVFSLCRVANHILGNL